jgi:uncharacterized delta-60 repeat protein
MKRDQRIRVLCSLLIAGVLSFGYTVQVQAVPGGYDPTFGIFGVSLDHVAGRQLFPYAIAQQSDGKLLVCGRFRSDGQTSDRLLLRRYLTNGAVDTGFGISGFAVAQISPPNANLNGAAFSVAVQADGKIVLSGASTWTGGTPIVWRFTAQGELDSTFGGGRVILGNPLVSGPALLGVAVVRNQIVTVYVPSSGSVAVTRLNSNGSVDTHFGINGIAAIGILAGADVAVDPVNARIVVRGYIQNSSNALVPALQRFDRDGHEDLGFGPNGIAVPNLTTPECPSAQPRFVSSIGFQSDGKIIAAGWHDIPVAPDSSYYSNFIVRLQTSGTVDLTFGVDGFAASCDARGNPPPIRVSHTTNQVVAVLGSVVDQPSASNFLRYGSTGIQNLAFPNDYPADLLIQSADEKIVTAEQPGMTGDIRLARLLP